MSVQPLSLEHQPIVAKVLRELCLTYDLQFPELSFACCFLFRRQDKYSFVECSRPCIRGEFKSGNVYFIPTTAPKNMRLEHFAASKEKSICLYPIPEKWLAEIDKFHPVLKSCRSETDYLFTIDKLQKFPGRALSSRRNLLSQLIHHHAMEAKPLTNNEIPSALTILDVWQENSGQTKEASDYLPARDALAFMERLELFGRIVYADGQPVGFTIGELLTPTTALLHFSKAIHAYKGLTPYLYQDFANHLPDTVRWINLEQDVGSPSLRKAKEAYDPDQLLTKWHVTIGKANEELDCD